METINLVFGGGGFLGRYIVEDLVKKGIKVRVFDMRKTFDLENVDWFLGDIRKEEDVLTACEGVTTVYHTVSPLAIRATKELFYSVNIIGTKNIIKCCIKTGVQNLVFTSSAGVLFTDKPLDNVREDTPYPTDHIDPYNASKAEAERIVLNANSKELRTCAIRPSGIFGPRDVQMYPSLIQAGKAGKSKYILGDGQNMFDFTYVENLSQAHLLAGEGLERNDSDVLGEAFHITNGEPMKFWDMATKIHEDFGYPKPSIKIPYSVARSIAKFLQGIAFIISCFVIWKPQMNLVTVTNASVSRTFDIGKARAILNYNPQISLEEGRIKTTKYFKSLEENSSKDK